MTQRYHHTRNEEKLAALGEFVGISVTPKGDTQPKTRLGAAYVKMKNPWSHQGLSWSGRRDWFPE
jgi:hypothetical protein